MDETRRLIDLMRQAEAARSLATDSLGINQTLALYGSRDGAFAEAQRLAEQSSIQRLRNGPAYDGVTSAAEIMRRMDVQAIQQARDNARHSSSSTAQFLESLRHTDLDFLTEARRAAELSVTSRLVLETQVATTSYLEIQRVVDAARAAMERSAPRHSVIAHMAQLGLSSALERIILPDVTSIMEMAAQASSVVDAHRRLLADQDLWRGDLATRMASVTAPWAMSADLGVSALAFGELSVFRDVVTFDDPFSPSTSAYVGEQLGALITSDDEESPPAREARRDAAGRNSALVAFPGASYGQVIVAAGFELVIPFAVAPAPEDGSEPVFDPHHNAILTHLEQHARQFVEAKLLAVAGATWLKHRVSGQVRQRWEDRREEARERGRPVYGLIQYADFFDLAEVIGATNNWTEAFAGVFRDKGSMQVAFRRLHPIRNDLAHSRPLSRGDVLDLVAESTRIFRALGVDVLGG